MINTDNKWFPCPVCLKPLDVRTSKRNKPYVICAPCGVQMFVRERAGIAAFETLVEHGQKENVLARLAQLEQRYRLKCPECGKFFWVNPGVGSQETCDRQSIRLPLPALPGCRAD